MTTAIRAKEEGEGEDEVKNCSYAAASYMNRVGHASRENPALVQRILSHLLKEVLINISLQVP